PHLVEAGRQAELQELLMDIDWIRAKLNASTSVHRGRPITDVNALLSDYDYVDAPEASLVRRALRMSSHVIATHPEQVGFQLFGRLGTSNAAALEQLCRRAIDEEEGTVLLTARPALSPPGALVLTLAGHEGWVNGATLLADGRRALSWSSDQTLK